LSLIKKTRIKSVIAALPGFHISPAFGTAAENLVYCSKEDPDPWVMYDLEEFDNFNPHLDYNERACREWDQKYDKFLL